MELLTADKLRIKGARASAVHAVLDLERRLRCRECDTRGRVLVSIKWDG